LRKPRLNSAVVSVAVLTVFNFPRVASDNPLMDVAISCPEGRR
jgi:hypothetical protein